MDRREFFKRGGQKAAQIAGQLSRAAAATRAERWIRPPFAVAELDFLLGCTRCDACIEACPHDVLFRLPEKMGRHAAGTPAMDLPAHGCHMCDGWPCAAACEADVLQNPDPADPPEPVKLATLRIDEGSCLPYSGPECGACASACPVPGALAWEDGVRPVIEQASCTGCALCREACITEPKAIRVFALDSRND